MENWLNGLKEVPTLGRIRTYEAGTQTWVTSGTENPGWVMKVPKNLVTTVRKTVDVFPEEICTQD